MKRTNYKDTEYKNTAAIFERAAAEIRDEEIDPSVIAAAAGRVWARIDAAATEQQSPGVKLSLTAPAERIEGCADFQTLIPAYLGRDLKTELSQSRILLLEDHVRECISCRKVLKEARAEQPATFAPRTSFAGGVSHGAAWRWGIAASITICLMLIAWLVIERTSPFSETLRATVHAASGEVYRVATSENRTIGVGEEIQKGEKIRTAKSATAVVRLGDGSLIEMNERAELSLSESARGVTINLERGNVIVQAAKQRPRHLYVATNDCLVSVTGTIFSVNSGTKGSRISVIEGEVRVDHRGDERVLHPGDQTTTAESLDPVPVRDEIAWSRDAERYVKLVGALTELRRELDQKVPRPGVRYESRLLKMVPGETVLYAALPNVSAGLSESYRIMQERIKQNAALREWWEKEHRSETPENGPRLDRIMDSIRECGEYLGGEIVIAASMNEQGSPDGPLVLAELRDAEGFRRFLEQHLKTLAGEGANSPSVRFVDDPRTAPLQVEAGKSRHEVFVWIDRDIFAAAPKLEALRRLAAAKDAGGVNFEGTPFYARIAETYREGAGLIVAADLEKIVASVTREGAPAAGGENRIEALRRLGLLDLKHFIAEHKTLDGRDQNRAVLSFNENSRGVASWLAAPGPMGALEYISPDANLAAAFVFKQPVALVDDLLGVMETAVPSVREHLKQVEARLGLDVRRDFAAPLGGEFAFAVDGPLLPTPSWKIIIEVYDPARLQQTFERLVEEINREAARHNQKGLHWERVDSGGGRVFYTLVSVDTGMELHYTYANGYMIAAPSRALVDRALRFRESGYVLPRSARFISTLPADGNANFSAIFYHDLAPVIEPLTRQLGEAKDGSAQQQALRSLGEAVKSPSLAYAYAGDNRIIFAADSRDGSPFGLSPASLFGLPGSFGIQHILEQGMHGNKTTR